MMDLFIGIPKNTVYMEFNFFLIANRHTKCQLGFITNMLLPCVWLLLHVSPH